MLAAEELTPLDTLFRKFKLAKSCYYGMPFSSHSKTKKHWSDFTCGEYLYEILRGNDVLKEETKHDIFLFYYEVEICRSPDTSSYRKELVEQLLDSRYVSECSKLLDSRYVSECSSTLLYESYIQYLFFALHKLLNNLITELEPLSHEDDSVAKKIFAKLITFQTKFRTSPSDIFTEKLVEVLKDIETAWKKTGPEEIFPTLERYMNQSFLPRIKNLHISCFIERGAHIFEPTEESFAVLNDEGEARHYHDDHIGAAAPSL